MDEASEQSEATRAHAKESPSDSASAAAWDVKDFGPPLNWIAEHATALLAVFGAIAYLVGYNAVAGLSDELGVQPSVFALDFRAYVVLSLANLLRFAWTAAWAVTAYVLGRGLTLSARLALVLAVAAGTLGLFVLQNRGLEPTPAWQLMLSAALGGAMLGLLGGALRSNSGRSMGLVLFGFGVVYFGWVFLVSSPESDARGWAETLLEGDVTPQSATTLDLVIRPVEVAVYGVSESQQSAGIPEARAVPDGDPVILLSDADGRAAFIHEGRVLVMDSQGLTFVTTPSD
jgi:hypothetical protein